MIRLCTAISQVIGHRYYPGLPKRRRIYEPVLWRRVLTWKNLVKKGLGKRLLCGSACGRVS